MPADSLSTKKGFHSNERKPTKSARKLRALQKSDTNGSNPASSPSAVNDQRGVPSASGRSSEAAAATLKHLHDPSETAIRTAAQRSESLTTVAESKTAEDLDDNDPVKNVMLG